MSPFSCTASEVSLDDLWIILDLRWCAFGDLDTEFNDVDVIADFEH